MIIHNRSVIKISLNQFKPSTLYKSLILIILLTQGTACKKYLTIPAPATSLNAKNVYEDNATAAAALTSVYIKMSDDFAGMMSVSNELSADNLAFYGISESMLRFYENNLTSTTGDNHWNTLYQLIYASNAAIEGLTRATLIKPAAKSQLMGEAYFIRAFCYFYLVNEYGEVPLVTSTIFNDNIKTGKTSESRIYEQMKEDLNHAGSLLGEHYTGADGFTAYTDDVAERIRPNKYAALALLARVQLYLKDYVAAEAVATEVLNNNLLYSSEITLDQVFLKNSKETIWSLQPVKINYNTYEGDIMGNADTRIGIYASQQLMESFESGDDRKNKWISSVSIDTGVYSYPSKYKVRSGENPITEYTIVLRLAEQYLIRAEARILQNNIEGGVQDLNILRSRAVDESLPANEKLEPLLLNISKEDAVNAVEQERRVELFAEWGDRWFDLKRTNRIDQIMSDAAPKKGGVWESYKSLFPIPQSEIINAPLLSQNPGYN
jgi:starch-binding outer membrane protein, SusD/RagB family